VNDPIVVTGVGVVSPIGIGFHSFAEGLRSGQSATDLIRAFDASGLPSRCAGEVEDALLNEDRHIHPRKASKLMSRATRFAVVAASLARELAGLTVDSVAPDRVGVCLGAGGMGITDLDLLEGQALAAAEAVTRSESLVGTEVGVGAAVDAGAGPGAGTGVGVGGVGDSPRWDVTRFSEVYTRRTNPLTMIRGLPNLAATSVAIQCGARGPNSTVTTACASGTQALGDALRVLQRGDADVMLTGGTDAMINPVGVLGFSLLGTLSRRNEEPSGSCRPFDRDRDGFVIGEGAAVLVLERASHARSRGARPLAEIAGYATTCDAYRMTDERPDASGATAAITGALADADLAPREIDYVNAHGTGTVMNDRMETRAIKQALGGQADKVAVSSTKGMMGHLLAAAGAVEAAAVIAAIEYGFLPPTVNHQVPDEECDLDYVPRSARGAYVRAAISNSFGFGGQNACLAIRRP